MDFVAIVKDFLEDFPDEVPILSPQCKVEFTIEFIPGASPISATPYKMIPKEVTNALAIFMDYMNKIFHLFLDKFIIVFINDILVYSCTREEHEEHLRIVLEVLKEKKLYTKLSKCELWLEKVVYDDGHERLSFFVNSSVTLGHSSQGHNVFYCDLMWEREFYAKYYMCGMPTLSQIEMTPNSVSD
ncbi:hypothetical protein CR513_15975, partial [Mucuna pruriens]